MKLLLRTMTVFFLTFIALSTTKAEERNLDSFSFGYGAAWGPKGRFGGDNDIRYTPKPLSLTVEGRRVYVDGYVDTRGSVNGATKKYGYYYQNQIVTEGENNTLHFHDYQSQVGEFGGKSDISHAIQLLYKRELAMIKACPIGFELGLDFSQINITERRRGSISQIEDVYTGNDPWFPNAPYDNSNVPNGEVLAIFNAPISRTTSPYPGGEAMAERYLDGNIVGLHVGPFVTLILAKHLELDVSAGLAVAFVDSTFRYNDFILAGANQQNYIYRAGETSSVETLFGPYIAARIRIPLSHRVDLSAEYQYRHMASDVVHTIDGRVGTLSFKESQLAILAIIFNF